MNLIPDFDFKFQFGVELLFYPLFYGVYEPHNVACFSLTAAPPICSPFRPALSIKAPAETPLGFLNMQPEFLVFNGWLFFL
jgi:hypothetical protein